MTMSTKIMKAIVAALMLGGVSTAMVSNASAAPFGSGLRAAATAHVRHVRRSAGVPAPSTAPARMIQVRPGLWVGSYQCITDLDRGGRDCSSGI
jgi:hypothetical protein